MTAMDRATTRSLSIIAAISLATLSHATPPRFIATPVATFQHPCGSGSFAPTQVFSVTEDGRVLCEAGCGSTYGIPIFGGSRPYISFPNGTVSELPHGEYGFTEPVAALDASRVLVFGTICPQVDGACTTTLAIAQADVLTPLTTAAASAPTLNDSNEQGWAVGWGGTSSGAPWRIRPDATLELLSVPSAWAIYPTGVAASGATSGSAYIGSIEHAVKWDASGAASILAPVEAGTSARGEGVGMDGSVVGQSNGRAVRWATPTSVMQLLPIGSASVATHMAGNPMAGSPLPVSYFGTHQNGSRVFRATGPNMWSDLGPIDASAQLMSLSVVAAPRPDLMIATGFTPMYEVKSLIWTLDAGLRPLESVVVNPPAAGAFQSLIVVDANAAGVILATSGFNGAAFRLTRLWDGDSDGDGIVNGVDLTRLIAQWGPVASGTRSAVDFDGNQTVDAADLATLLASWTY